MAKDKTYYQTLGVTPDAEDIVIRAAYKAYLKGIIQISSRVQQRKLKLG